LIRVCDRIAEKSNCRKNFKEKWGVVNPKTAVPNYGYKYKGSWVQN